MEKIELNLISKIILGILVIGIVILLFIDNSNWFKSMYADTKNEHFSGIIIKKEIQRDNHSMRVIYINIKPIDVHPSFYESIDVGDSIIKKKGDFRIKLYKKNGVFLEFDYDSLIKKSFPLQYKAYFKEIEKNKNR